MDLSRGEAVSLTKILLREEAASLSLLRSGGSLTQVRLLWRGEGGVGRIGGVQGQGEGDGEGERGVE